MEEFLYCLVGVLTLQLVIAALLGWVARVSDVVFDDELEKEEENIE